MRGQIRKRVNKRGDISWQVIVSLGKDPITGKYKKKWVTVRGTRKDAEKKLVELLQQVDTGTFVDPGKLTVAEYLQRWLKDHKKNIAPSTYERYRIAIFQHLIPAIGSIPLQKLQPLHIQEMYTRDLEEGRRDNKKSVGKGLSPNTVLYHHRVLHKALEQAVKLQLLSRNPADYVDPPKKAKKSSFTVLSQEDVALLLEAAKGTYLYMPIFLAVHTGMRMGEILGLRWGDVDLERGEIHVRQALYQRKQGEPVFKPPKAKSSLRTIAISPTVVKELKAHRKLQLEERVHWGSAYKNFNLVCCLEDGSPIHPPTLSSAFRNLARKLGIPVTFHGLRHLHASYLLSLGVHPKVVSERLGHSQISITQDLYSHVMPTLQREAAQKLEKILRDRRG